MNMNWKSSSGGSFFGRRSKFNSSNFLVLWTVLSSFLIGFCLSYLRPRSFKPRRGICIPHVIISSSQTSQTGDAVEPTSSTGANSSPYGGFYDEAIIYVRAGSGGQGASTYARISSNGSGKTLGKPNGGQGGNGGSVLLQVDSSLNTLAHLNYASYRPNSYGGAAMSERKHSNSNNRWIRSFRAENGADGKSGFKNGRWADDTIIHVPSGTIVQEIIMEDGQGSKEEILGEVGETVELSVANNLTSVVLAQGGAGGDGSAVAGKRRSSPQGGERKHFKLTLKIVGDVAIVGLPNAGKSTLLAAVTRAKPRIANYPFTTVIPNLGVWIGEENDDEHRQHSYTSGKRPSTLVLCDVPGLISGAADGVGLGHAFLRHVERCHVLLHIVDATSDDPLHDFDVINQELTRYGNGCLVNKPQIVVVNKCDVWEKMEDVGTGVDTSLCKISKHDLEQELRKKMPHSRLVFISASNKQGVEDLMHRLSIFTEKVKNSAVPSTE